jgi:hypothetical protein
VVGVPAAEDEAVVWAPALTPLAAVGIMGLAYLSLRASSLARFSLRILRWARFSAVRAWQELAQREARAEVYLPLWRLGLVAVEVSIAVMERKFIGKSQLAAAEAAVVEKRCSGGSVGGCGSGAM